nr:MAG TPA: restriction alleviation protein [Caudoviricetes sp.]
MIRDKLKPCPFCGGSAKIVLCDDEGNLHDEDYALRPYSGVGFMIRHTHEENPQCPIARYEVDGGIVGGVYIYDTEEQAVEAWNRRVNDALVRHGHWIGEGDGYADGELVFDVWHCSECDYCIDDGTDDPELLPKYCPGCGALMDGGKDNG